MAYRIRYAPLFSIAIRHGFHLNEGRDEFEDLPAEKQQRKLARYDWRDDLRLVVPADTQRVLAGLGGVIKTTPDSLLVGVELADGAPGASPIPARIPVTGFRLRFALRARGPLFWNYTNLSLAPRDASIYHTTNRVGDEGGEFPDLAAPPAVYAAGADYAAGDVVRPAPAASARFLSVRAGAHGAPAGGAAAWLELAARNYLGDRDRVSLRAPRFEIPLAPGLSSARAEVVAGDGSVHEVGSSQAAVGQELSAIHVDTGDLPPARYTLNVRDAESDALVQSEILYIDPELVDAGIFAVIEIAHVPGGTLGDYRLYDEAAGHRLRSPQFVFRLLNRHTYWRYRFSEAPAPGTDLGDLEEIAGQFVTRNAMPLTSSVQSVAFDDDKLLPNPTVRHIIPESDRVYSDVQVFLNP